MSRKQCLSVCTGAATTYWNEAGAASTTLNLRAEIEVVGRTDVVRRMMATLLILFTHCYQQAHRIDAEVSWPSIGYLRSARSARSRIEPPSAGSRAAWRTWSTTRGT